MRRIIFCLISVIAQTNIATAVVVNIDFGIHPIFAGDPTPLPPPPYAAAGSPGIWNAISQVPTTPSGALVDINGAPLSLTLSSSVLAWSSPFPAFDADILAEDEQMLRWALVRSDGLTHLGLTLTFSNLSAGTYRITTYVAGSGTSVVGAPYEPELGIFGSQQIVSGDASQGMLEGQSYTVHELYIDGSFSLYATNPNGGYINGMQIQQIPEPSSFTLFALAALLYCLVVRRQQKGVRN